MEKGNIVKFAPELLGAIKETMGRLPSMPGDLAKIKALTIFNKHDYNGEPGCIFMNWMELAPGRFSAVGAMENLHTLLFKNERILYVRDFTFLSKLKKLKKLDLSGTNFCDCALLKELPALQHAVLPDRRRLIHTEVLMELSARVEPKPERDERERARDCYEGKGAKGGKNAILLSDVWSAEDTCAADPRLIRWIAASLGKIPDTPSELAKIRCLDSLDTMGSLDKRALQAEGMSKLSDAGKTFTKDKLPSWLMEKEGDFSLIAKLPNLRTLFLWDTNLEDFSFLAECRQVFYINLWNTNFADCRILEDLPKLQCICLPKKEKLKNFSVLKERQAAEANQMKEEAQEEMYGEGREGISPSIKRPLLIKIEPELVVLADLEDEEEACRQFVKPQEGKNGKQRKNGVTTRDVSVKTEKDVPMERYSLGRKEKKSTADETKINPQMAGRENNSFYRDDEFDDLALVRGEDVVISYQGSSRVRHVAARFWMDVKVAPMWEKFLEMEEEEGNWAKFSTDRARTMTDELVRAVARGDVADLFLSLDPWGEGPYLALEFAQGWATIDYMDDEDAVYYSIYNPLYPKASQLCPVKVGGQSPVPKMLAVEDFGLASEIVRYFLEKGQLLPGTLWKTNLDINEKSDP